MRFSSYIYTISETGPANMAPCVDDYPRGEGDDPPDRAYGQSDSEPESQRHYDEDLYLSTAINQGIANQMSLPGEPLIILCGHQAEDQRIRE